MFLGSFRKMLILLQPRRTPGRAFPGRSAVRAAVASFPAKRISWWVRLARRLRSAAGLAGLLGMGRFDLTHRRLDLGRFLAIWRVLTGERGNVGADQFGQDAEAVLFRSLE